MHVEAYHGFDQMLRAAGVNREAKIRVLDFGGQNVNGTVHDLLPNATITTLDLENADIIADATTYVPEPIYDMVIATEMFEHVENWRQVIANMRAGLDPEGLGIFITTAASTDRQPHGATGAPLPAPGEWYRNVNPAELKAELGKHFELSDTFYRYPPGDVYAWGAVGGNYDITVIIPTIKPRAALLDRAKRSVNAQTLHPKAVIVEEDIHKEGPAVVRNRALAKVETEWVAFLDDDDEFLPEHLRTLAVLQLTTGADVVWPWFKVVGGGDPFPMHRGRQWDPADPHQIPITVLARTSALRAVGGFQTVGEGPTDPDGNRAGEDWRLWLDLSAAGYRFAHTPEITWTWHHDSGNTSGLPSRW